MFKEIKVHAHFNERTGFGIHASRFFPELDKLVREANGTGEVHISLLDTVTAAHTTERHPAPSILYNVWESTKQPDDFMEKLSLYDQMWVPSEWQRAASIAQGVPEEFIKVVPEGVDPDIYKPSEFRTDPDGLFIFVHVGQWQPRKSTIEIIQSYLKAFPLDKDPLGQKTRLELSVDTLFPSDNYKSTEERLKAYGFDDPRIRVVHFEERDEYIRRLQNAHCFVSCSRSEGWGLPIIEAMACGIPTIVADWGGSTEYAADAIRVRVKELIKPYGIYGNWDVPGFWCEPDFDHLVAQMKNVYATYAMHKEKALLAGERIREQFSWKQAAVKAYNILGELYNKQIPDLSKQIGIGDVINKVEQDVETMIKEFARKHGFEVTGMKPIPSVFVIGTWPNSQEKMDTLIETINQVKEYGYPILISTHYALPPSVVELADYVIYEKKNVLSDDWRAMYVRTKDGKLETKQSRIPYHGVACLNAFRNAIDFCRKKFVRMYYLEYDCGIELDKFMAEVRKTDKPFTGIRYEGKGLRTDIWSGDIEFLDGIIPHIGSWKEYTAGMKDVNSEYPLEIWLYKNFGECINDANLVDLPVDNIYDQTDRELWEDDVFQYHFVEGPFLNIAGISRREYEVSFGIDERNVYNLQQKCGMWSRPSIKYYLPWIITARLNGVVKFSHTFDCTGKRVLISFGSKALGDTIAWMPYVEEFRKKHKCHVICSGWWQEIFDYPEIEYVKPGERIEDLYATYDVGCYDGQLEKNPKDWRTVPLQKVAADILGLEYEPIRAKLKKSDSLAVVHPHTVCFSEFSTMQNKLWNREGAWQKVVDFLCEAGYTPMSISFEKTELKNVIAHNGQSIYQTIADVANCEFYIGLNHGPAWIAYALNKPVVMITGVSEEWNDFPNPYRVQKLDTCRPGCFNDPSVPIDRGWAWCPRNKNFACTREITEEMVIEQIKEIIYASKDKETKGREVSGEDPEFRSCEGDNSGESQEATAAA